MNELKLKYLYQALAVYEKGELVDDAWENGDDVETVAKAVSEMMSEILDTGGLTVCGR